MTRTFVIEDDHQSGRFDAVPRERLRMNHQIAQTANIGLITEYQGLDWLIHGWGEHGTESRIVWDQSVWSIKHKDSVVIKTGPWKRGTSDRESLDVPWGLLDHAGFTLLRGGGHTPAHLDDPRQLHANDAVLAGLTPAFRQIIGDLKPDAVSLSFDLNRQVTLARNQAQIEDAVKGLGLHLLVPPGTTHKPGRRIDAFLVSRGKDEQEMLSWLAGYDHRGIRRTRKVRVA